MSNSLHAAPVASATAVPSDRVLARYMVVGHADPGLLPRVIEPVAKLGHVPMRVHASREAGDGSEVSIDLRLGAVTTRVAEQVSHALHAIVGVRQVIASLEPLPG